MKKFTLLFTLFFVSITNLQAEWEDFEPLNPFAGIDASIILFNKFYNVTDHIITHISTSPAFTKSKSNDKFKIEDYKFIFEGDSIGNASVFSVGFYSKSANHYIINKFWVDHNNMYAFLDNIVIDSAFYSAYTALFEPKIKFNLSKQLILTHEDYKKCIMAFNEHCPLAKTIKEMKNFENSNFVIGIGRPVKCEMFGTGGYFSDFKWQHIFYAAIFIDGKMNFCWSYLDAPEVFYCYNEINSIAGAPVSATSLCPNPANSVCTISGFLETLAKDFSISIYDIAGNKLFDIYNDKNLEGEFSVSFNTKQLVSGSYNVIINADGAKKVEKLIIER